MDLKPNELVNLIDQSVHTKGLEIFVNLYNDSERKYLRALVPVLVEHHLILQVHGGINFDLDKQIDYLKELESYTEKICNPIIFTLHYISDEKRNICVEQTIDYIDALLKNIDNNKIIICLENLDNGKKLFDLVNSSSLYGKISFTYDIGHEMCFCGGLTGIDKSIFKLVKNIHLHTCNKNGVDHMPIYCGDMNEKDIIEGVSLLKNTNYHGSVVFEYGLEYCYGKSVMEKIKSYLNSIDYVYNELIIKN